MALRKATAEEIKYVGECRKAIKGANFCLLYGGGVKTLAQSLISADPNLTEKEAKKLATTLIQQKKGMKNEDGFYFGGSDSVIYNALLEISQSSKSQLPGLGTKISAAMRADAVGNDFVTARTNFCIQATGAEILSVIITVISALIKKYNLDAHYVMAIHDELLFMCHEDQTEEFCAVMNIAHFYTMNFFHERFGVTEFPWARAFFDGIEVRKISCKEAHEDTTTISNPKGDPFGKSVTIKDVKKSKSFEKLKARL